MTHIMHTRRVAKLQDASESRYQIYWCDDRSHKTDDMSGYLPFTRIKSSKLPHLTTLRWLTVAAETESDTSQLIIFYAKENSKIPLVMSTKAKIK